jgi:hypothetical protein
MFDSQMVNPHEITIYIEFNPHEIPPNSPWKTGSEIIFFLKIWDSPYLEIPSGNLT